MNIGHSFVVFSERMDSTIDNISVGEILGLFGLSFISHLDISLSGLEKVDCLFSISLKVLNMAILAFFAIYKYKKSKKQ